jgi:hypothetical protein
VPEITSLAEAILRNRLNAQRLVALAGVFVLLSACAQVATVKNVKPLPPSVAAVSGTRLASARDEERSPEVALSHDLDVAAKAWAALKEDPGKAQSRELYNYSVGRVVERVYQVLPLRFQKYGLSINSEKTRVVRFARPQGGEHNQEEAEAATFDFLASPTTGADLAKDSGT